MIPRILLLTVASFGIITPALADSDSINPDRIILGVGKFNALDGQNYQRQNEYRIELRLPSLGFWGVHPWAGYENATKEVSWVGAGLESDIPLWSSNWIVTLQTGVGYFDNGKTGYPELSPKDAKYDNPDTGIEFRHQLEIAYQFEGGYRLSLGISHMSNAHIEDKHNHDTEDLNLNVHVPLNFWKKL